MERWQEDRCNSEGSDPVVDPRITKLCFDDSGNAALNARRLLDGKYGDTNKIEVIRPGHFVPGPIRESGLKRPLLIKGDRYNFNPQMGVALLDTGLTAAELEERMDKEKEVETWDVMKQRPGPQWKLGQFTTYWHARQEFVARQALQEAKQQTVAAGRYGEEAGMEEDLEDDGNSGQVLVLQRQGGLPRAAMRVSTQVGIAPEQAMKLFCGEYLSLAAPPAAPADASNPNPAAAKPLTDEIHPPPTILSIDLVRMLERHLGKDTKPFEVQQHQRANDLSSSGGAKASEKQGDRHAGPQGSCSTAGGEKGGGDQAEDASSERVARTNSGKQGGVPAIGPAQTIHLQMTPVGCFTDFRAAPGGAATWLYVLTGRKVLALLPPTARNRSLYMAWAQASLAQSSKSQVLDVFLADYAEDAMRVEVKQNEALIIPSGWFYASVATQDCIAVCCFFWHPYALGDVARTQHLQMHLKQRDTDLCRKARQLMWCAALHYARNLRERLGLPAYCASRPGGSVHATTSNSQGSGFQQQQRLSPRSRLLCMTSSAGGAAAAAAGQGSAPRKTPRGTPPMTGFAAALQQQYAGDSVLLSPAQSPSGRRGTKRSRGEAMDALQLPESAIPLTEEAATAAAAAAAAAASGARTPRATSSAAAAAAVNAPAGQKKLKISTFSAGGGAATPRSVSRGGGMQQHQQQQAQQQQQQQRSGDSHSTGAAGPSHHYQQQEQQPQASGGGGGTPRLRLKGSTARQQQQQQDRQRWSWYSAAAAGGEDIEDGDCQTSPVRHPPAGDAYLDMFDQHHHHRGEAAAAGPARRGVAGAAAAAGAGAGYDQQQHHADGMRGYFRQVDMSPIVGGMRGDADVLPPLNMGASALPPLQLPSAAGGTAQQQGLGQSPAPQLPTGGNATPRVKIKLKTAGKTPLSSSAAAGNAAPSTSGATGTAGGSSAAAMGLAAAAGGATTPRQSSDGAAAGVAAGGTQGVTGGGGSSSPQAKSGDTAGAPAATGVSRRSTPEESCCRNSLSHQQGSGSNEASQHQQHQQQSLGLGPQQQQQQQAHVQQQQQRRVSDSANSRPLQPPAAGGAAAAATAAVGSRSVPTKIKLRLPTPSPQLGPSTATAAAEAALPPLQLGQSPGLQQGQQAVPSLQLNRLAGLQQAAKQQQQQGQTVPQIPVMPIPQVDGANDDLLLLHAAAGGVAPQHSSQQQEGVQQQQQCHFWARWQQLQADHHRQFPQQQQQQSVAVRHSAGRPAAAGWGAARIPQCDGAGDDRGSGDTQGPTLVMQPAPAGSADAQRHQQQQQHKQQQQQQQPFGLQQLPIKPGLQRLQQGTSSSCNGTTTSSPRGGAADQVPLPGADGAVTGGGEQPAAPAAAKAVILKNPTVHSLLQPHLPHLHQRRPPASAATAAGNSRPSLSPPLAAAAAAAAGVSPFEAAIAELAAGRRESAGAGAGVLRMQDADAAMHGGAGGESASISREGSSLFSTAAELAAMAPAAAAAGSAFHPQGSRSGSPITNQPPAAAAAAAATVAGQAQQALPAVLAAPPAAVAAPQQQQAMLPPLPVKVSSWEVMELPVLLEYLQEQLATAGGSDFAGGGGHQHLSRADLPPGVTDPGYLLEQLEEAVREATERERQEVAAAALKAAGTLVAPPAAAARALLPGGGGSAAAAAAGAAGAGGHGLRGSQPLQPRGLPEVAAEAAAWQALCGDLHPEPLQPDTMRLAVEFTTALQQGFEVQRTLGWGEEQMLEQDTLDAVVGETDPTPGANSYGGHSAGSYHSGAGTAKGAREAAGREQQQQSRSRGLGGSTDGRLAAAAAAGASTGGAVAGAKRPPPPATKGEQEAKNARAAKVMKGLNIGGTPKHRGKRF